MRTDPGLAEVDATALLEAVGRELAQLGQLGEVLQETLAPGRAADGMQVLDVMTQRLFAMADLLHGMAPGNAAARQAALAAVPLADLAQRLRGLAPGPLPLAGELDLFEHG